MKKTEEKLKRIERLHDLGYNTPRVLKIPQGTQINESWERRMRMLAGGSDRMTVRTYHPFDELSHPSGPFKPEQPIDRAIQYAKEFVKKWHVLWQEAIDVKDTLITGTVLLSTSGEGSYDILKGVYRVRDVYSPPAKAIGHSLSESFSSWRQIANVEMRQIVFELKDIPIKLNLSRIEDGVIVEFNLQKRPVGLLMRRLLLWEWRLRSFQTAPARINPATIPRRSVRTKGRQMLGIGVEGLPIPNDEPSRDLLGAKGANLEMMLKKGMKMPPGFVISTNVFRHFGKALAFESDMPVQFIQALRDSYELLKETYAKRSTGRPLLVSVRSSPVVSMPGMMRTVLNVGLNAETMRDMYIQTRNYRFSTDLARRFMLSFGEALGYKRDDGKLESLLRRTETERNSHQLEPSAMLKQGMERLGLLGFRIPTDPFMQLRDAVSLVVRSWFSGQAKYYRRVHGIPEEIGTAVVIQAMVFGNLNRLSGTGVGFSRNPATGGSEVVVEYLRQAQGEDIVSGAVSPRDSEFLKRSKPRTWAELLRHAKVLEKVFLEMQEFEFTVESGQLFFLQSRDGLRSKAATVRIAHDLLKERVISEETARKRIEDIGPRDLFSRRLLIRGAVPAARAVVASTGAAVGLIALTSQSALRMKANGKNVILVKDALTTSDYRAISEVDGILTARGGATSHAATIARQHSCVCFVNCRTLEISSSRRKLRLGSTNLSEGDIVSLDGNLGQVFVGALSFDEPIRQVGISAEIARWFSAIKSQPETPQIAALRKRNWNPELKSLA